MGVVEVPRTNAPSQMRRHQQPSGSLQVLTPLGVPENTEASLVVGLPKKQRMAAAFPGCALALILVVAMGANPPRKERRRWRKTVRSENAGRRAARKDKRPELFGPEKPPHEKKKIYDYYCNKIYKVIRDSSSMDMAPASQDHEVSLPRKTFQSTVSLLQRAFRSIRLW